MKSSSRCWLIPDTRVLVILFFFANSHLGPAAVGGSKLAAGAVAHAPFEMLTGNIYAPSSLLTSPSHSIAGNLSYENPTFRRARSVLQRRQYGGEDVGRSSAAACARTDGECMSVLHCYISGGQTTRRCGGSIFYACCYKPVMTRSSPNFDLGSVLGSANALPVSFGAPGIETEKAIESGFDDNAVCGQTSNHKKLQRRIIGGDDANFGEFPWQAHIKIGRQQCGGALVSHNYVLTAAHCVHLNPLRRITVVLGAFDIQSTRYARSSSARTYRIVEKKIHPNFAFSASQPDRFDVALLRLDQHVQYQENILPVCLPPRGWTFEGWRATVTGWGKTDASLNNRYGTRVLQKVQVPIITRQECEKWHQLRGIHIKIFPEMMCAGYKEGKRDACVGDSGGPMTLFLNGRWTIVGITSAGFGCAQSHQPGIYHQVSVSVDWILANL
ncbi:trypsin-1-like [Galendromus occidentalis]|uniref:Trypsin-1-like n=1 Tax=Galendromus occidentalis TaxID=34638 RepID=A0AAJ6QMJ1_9ACAR|nr:trypsin-1-like [Galendromus occidentalis]